jgi:hypothetical protein
MNTVKMISKPLFFRWLGLEEQYERTKEKRTKEVRYKA